MALISVVVPVHNVQPYLRECLDSILKQQYRDIELIAVNDCTPDGCGEIIDEYALADPRVRTIHLPENVGLGRARNAGLAQATGEYVWFVDSDDTIASDALGHIAERIRQTTPDVLIVDYARTYWWKRQTRNMLHSLLSVPDAPEVFRISERDELLRIFPCAWNKVVRREFMLESGILFPVGWYEDLAFTYPILANAKRISVLDHVCYFYRQRRHGAILGTSSDRHFELISQYDLVFERLSDAGEEGEKIRPRVLGQAIEHFIVVVGHPRRLSSQMKPRFFRAMVDFRRRHITGDGYIIPLGGSKARHRVVALGSWLIYRALRAGRGLGQRSRASTRWAKDRFRRTFNKANKAVHLMYYAAQRKLPIDRELAVYSIYWGRGYGCNPAAIYERAQELAPNVHGVWVVSGSRVAEMPAGVDIVIENSWRYFRVMARANWFFNNVNFASHFVKRPSTIHVQTHHGTTLKSMGIDCIGYPLAARGTNFGNLLRRSDRWDFSLSSNSYSTEVWARAYPCSYESLEYGYPRNDLLINATPTDVLKIRADLGLAPHQRVILYAPTHRDYSSHYQEFLDLDLLAERAGSDTVILKRAHHFDSAKIKGADGASERVIDVSDYPRVEELYLAADILLTDYSSVMFDFGILDRPIVIYAPDWAVYQATRGTYFDLLREPPGAVATTEGELLRLFENDGVDTADTAALRASFRQRFCHVDDGRAAERVIRRVILGETVDVLHTPSEDI